MADAGNTMASRKMTEAPALHMSAVSKLRHCALFGGVLLGAASVGASPAEAATAPVQAAYNFHVVQKKAATAVMPKSPLKAVAGVDMSADSTTTAPNPFSGDTGTLENPAATEQQVAAALADMEGNLNSLVINASIPAVNALAQRISSYGGPGAFGTLDPASLQNLETAISLLGSVISMNTWMVPEAGAAVLPQGTFDAVVGAVIPFANPAYAMSASFQPACTCLFAIVDNSVSGCAAAGAPLAAAFTQLIASYGGPGALGTLSAASVQNLEAAMSCLGSVISTNASLSAAGTPGLTVLPQDVLDSAASAVSLFTSGTSVSFPQIFQGSFSCLMSILDAEPTAQALSGFCNLITNATDQQLLAELLNYIRPNLLGPSGVLIGKFSVGAAQVSDALAQRITAYGGPSTFGNLDSLSMQNLQGTMSRMSQVIYNANSLAIALSQATLDSAASAVVPLMSGTYTPFPSVFLGALSDFGLILNIEPAGQAPPANACSTALSCLGSAVDSNTLGPMLLLLSKMNIQIGSSGFIGRWKAQYDTLQAADPRKEILGTCISACCMTNPALADTAAYNAMLGLDSATIAAMYAASPTWNLNGGALVPVGGAVGYNPYADYQKIYDISQAYPGVPLVKTLFRYYNITLFSNYPNDIIRHLYYDRNTPVSGKRMVIMEFTKMPNSVDFGSLIFPAFDYDTFDIRVIEPGNPANMVALMDSTSARLGGELSTGLILNDHGSPTQINLAKTVASADPELGSEPNDLNVNDSAIMVQIAQRLVPGAWVILNACGTAGVNEGPGGTIYPDLAQAIAQDMHVICFGADTVASGVQSIAYDADFNVTRVIFNGSPTGVYDGRSTTRTLKRPLAPVSAPSVRHDGSTYVISAPNGTECTIYDLAGRAIERLTPDAAGDFILKPEAAAGVNVARILVKEGNTISVKYLRFSKIR